jgi:hypothetical protein
MILRAGKFGSEHKQPGQIYCLKGGGLVFQNSKTSPQNFTGGSMMEI